MCVYGYHFPIVSSVYYLVSLLLSNSRFYEYLQINSVFTIKKYFTILYNFFFVFISVQHRSGGRPEHYIDSSWAKQKGALFLFIKFLLEYSHSNLFYVFSMAGFEVIKHKNSKIFVTQTLIIKFFSHLHLHEVQYWFLYMPRCCLRDG